MYFAFQTFGAGSREEISRGIIILGPICLFMSSSAENIGKPIAIKHKAIQLRGTDLARLGPSLETRQLSTPVSSDRLVDLKSSRKTRTEGRNISITFENQQSMYSPLYSI